MLRIANQSSVAKAHQEFDERKEASPELVTTLPAGAMSHEVGQDATKDELK